MNTYEQHFETQAIRTQLEKSPFNEHSPPIYLTSSFTFENAESMRAVFAEETEQYSYSRFNNPNSQELVDKLCLLEQAEAGYSFSTGMAAIYCSFSALLKAGDHILSCSCIFGSTLGIFNKIFPDRGIHTSYFDFNATEEEIEQLVQVNTKVIFLESPTNPGVDLVDLELIGRIAKKHGLLFIVDNSFATPYLQTPITWGADLVVHSATKLIDGQGRVCAGVTLGKKTLIDQIYLFSRTIGASLAPFSAWILSKSLETLHVRVDRHCENALATAQFLESHPAIATIKYPFLSSHPQHHLAKRHLKQGGNIIAFGVRGGLEGANKFIDSVRLCSRSANLGDTRSIVTHPATTTHCRLAPSDRLAIGITNNLIRLSVGLENVKDLIADLDQALNNVINLNK